MLRLYAYNAGKGDCIRIEFGSGRNILIDTGVMRFAPGFKAICDNLSAPDILVLTHADDDHVGGILSLLRLGWDCPFKEVRMNVLETSLAEAPNVYLSTKQNNEVYDRLVKQGVKIKPMLSGMDIVIEGAKITTLLPVEIKTDNRTKDVPLAFRRDYGRALSDLAEEPIKASDTSISNKNSIVFVFEYKGQRLLFLGDAWADDVITAIGDDALFFDFVKLSHHGSVANISEAFRDHIQAQNFLVCTDGVMHPDKQTIAKLAKWFGRINIYSPSEWWERDFFIDADDRECVNLIHKEGLVFEW